MPQRLASTFAGSVRWRTVGPRFPQPPQEGAQQTAGLGCLNTLWVSTPGGVLLCPLPPTQNWLQSLQGLVRKENAGLFIQKILNGFRR